MYVCVVKQLPLYVGVVNSVVGSCGFNCKPKRTFPFLFTLVGKPTILSFKRKKCLSVSVLKKYKY